MHFPDIVQDIFTLYRILYTFYSNPPLNSTKTAFCLGALILSNRSTLITNVPLPAVKLRKCFKYPTISFNGTLAVIVRGLFAVAVAAEEPVMDSLLRDGDSKGSRGA